ncbi:MAG: tetratricopeptide repeat protein [Pseudomonadota bacterium]
MTAAVSIVAGPARTGSLVATVFVAALSLAAVFAPASEALATENQASKSKEPATTSQFSAGFKRVRQQRLDKLFAELKSAPNAKAGRLVVAKIWEMWMTSGNVNIDALLRQAQIALQEGGVQEAYLALNRVIEIAPDFSEGWNRRATLHYMTGRYAESVGDIQKTLALEPRHFGALAGLGMIYMAEKRWSAALKAFETAADVNPWLQNRDAILKTLREKANGKPL